MPSKWVVTARGAEQLRAYAEGEEIPAALAESLPSHLVRCERYVNTPPEPTEPGAYLIDGHLYVYMEPRPVTGTLWADGYRWRQMNAARHGRFRWSGIYTWDEHPNASIQRLLPQAGLTQLPAVTPGEADQLELTVTATPGSGHNRHVLLTNAHGFRLFTAALSVDGNGVYLDRSQAYAVYDRLGQYLREGSGS